jgi:hypothetical protein
MLLHGFALSLSSKRVSGTHGEHQVLHQQKLLMPLEEQRKIKKTKKMIKLVVKMPNNLPKMQD